MERKYIYYKGKTKIFEGTLQEIADECNKKIQTLKGYLTPTYRDRVKKIKNTRNTAILVPVDNGEVKACKVCKNVKPIFEFYCKKYKGNYDTLCSVCRLERRRNSKNIRLGIVEPKKTTKEYHKDKKCNECRFLEISKFQYKDKTRSAYCSKYNRLLEFVKDKGKIKRPLYCVED